MKVRQADGRSWVVLERDSLGDAFAELARKHELATGWVRGVGKLRWVELSGPGRVRGPLVLLSLEGSLGPDGQLAATVAKSDGSVLGGMLVDAGAERVELFVERFVEAAAPSKSWVAPAEDEDDAPAPAAPSWGEVAAASAQQQTDTNAAVAWQQVAAASEPAPEPPRPSRAAPRSKRGSSKRSNAAVPELLPQKGDFIHHRQFGRCKIDGPAKGGGVVVRLPSGIRKTIRLDYLDVGQPRDENGRRVFPVRPKKR